MFEIMWIVIILGIGIIIGIIWEAVGRSAIEKLFEEKVIEEYDENKNLIHYKDEWKEKEFRYDKHNNLIHIKVEYKNSDGWEEWFEYDENNNLIHYKDTDGQEEWYKYDENNNKIYEIDNEGWEYWYKYDNKNREIYSKQYCPEYWYRYEFDKQIEITEEEYNKIYKKLGEE